MREVDGGTDDGLVLFLLEYVADEGAVYLEFVQRDVAQLCQ